MYLRLLWLLLFSLAFVCVGCDPTEHPFQDKTKKRELLVYCGMTMIDPVMELAAIAEREKKCDVKITYGGSGHIQSSVEINKIGDIFFPGTEQYIDSLRKEGLITDFVQVGHNEIAFFVQKGNPKNIKPDLNELLREGINVVIGSVNSGAIGRETKWSLDQLGIYEQVTQRALYLTTDSKGLAKSLRSGEADLVVNFRTTAFVKNNKDYMELLPLPDGQIRKKNLVMGILTFSKYPEDAAFFLDLASSARGKAIFAKYGF